MSEDQIIEALDGLSGDDPEHAHGAADELLLAAVRRLTPDPLDVPATLSQEETIKAVAREFADGARKRLENLTGVAGQ